MSSIKQMNQITLKGSAAIVSEFFFYGINNILFQRGIYPPEMFKQEKKYGLTILVTTDDSLLKYLKVSILPQLTKWLETKVVKRVAIVIRENGTNESLERWQFEIEYQSDDNSKNTVKTKDMDVIKSEIQAVIRQITSAVTFLPLLDVPCFFDVLFYTDNNTKTPPEWEESNAYLIENSEEVKLRSFSTSLHKVDGVVSYKFSM